MNKLELLEQEACENDVKIHDYYLGEDTLKALQLRRIAPDEVNLTPKLIRYNR